jgi:hypothetical protein
MIPIIFTAFVKQLFYLFFPRTLLFSPDVPVRVDYQGKRVDMTHGPLAGLLMGLAQLNCSELRLKRLSYRHGYVKSFSLFYLKV